MSLKTAFRAIKTEILENIKKILILSKLNSQQKLKKIANQLKDGFLSKNQ